MTLPKPHLAADVSLPEIAVALSDWSWFLGDGWTPWLVSAVGDVFLINPAGEITRLDTGIADVETVAPTREAFETTIADPDILADWFLEPVVDELRKQGKVLEPGQCYGFTILPIFNEGSYGAANRFALGAAEHIRLTGDLHRQLREVPDGATVQIRVSD
jgi:hypothetical protein